MISDYTLVALLPKLLSVESGVPAASGDIKGSA